MHFWYLYSLRWSVSIGKNDCVAYEHIEHTLTPNTTHRVRNSNKRYHLQNQIHNWWPNIKSDRWNATNVFTSHKKNSQCNCHVRWYLFDITGTPFVVWLLLFCYSFFLVHLSREIGKKKRRACFAMRYGFVASISRQIRIVFINVEGTCVCTAVTTTFCAVFWKGIFSYRFVICCSNVEEYSKIGLVREKIDSVRFASWSLTFIYFEETQKNGPKRT